MKRSRSILLSRLRGLPLGNTLKKVLINGSAIAISGAFIAGCSDSSEEAIVIKSIDDCLTKTDMNEEQCTAAYRQAEEEALRTAPRYSSSDSCQAEFGIGGCRPIGNYFMPAMAGYLFGRAMDRSHPATVYRYNRPFSANHDKFMTADGMVLGSAKQGSFRVSKSTYKAKPKVTRTVSRGGFGSKASAKSSWGSSSSRSSWGG
ncbi:DUF1190 domain-containing protein [Desulfosediminicola sp.]|uniref:DUF1190 domain-containing protein n=1 Tax=Desulfosediminicola sp. TaxID=2886825 RepID=UPI003AF256DF